jgi:hypothetical protein
MSLTKRSKEYVDHFEELARLFRPPEPDYDLLEREFRYLESLKQKHEQPKQNDNVDQRSK